ncbi:MAG: hypothetical protein P4L31_00365, partial [Candidatus Babeliales bacterium]|nr:hypothetical protein [Candidatus Babeliales bacterium]
IGSNSIPSLQPTIVFPASDSDNSVLGFAWMKNGFTLENAATSCLFASIYPVSGFINLNGGALNLTTDLSCDSGVVISGNNSTVNMNGRACNLGQLDLNWTDATNWQGDIGKVNLFSNLVLSNTWTFSGHCVLDGNGHVFDITNGHIVIESGSSLTITNLTLRNLSATNIQCVDNLSVVMLENVDWSQLNNFVFTNGALQLQNAVNFIGNAVFAYQSTQPCTLFAHSTVTLDSGFTFSYDPGTSADLLIFEDSTSQLVLNNNATLHTTLQGLNLTNGSILIQANGSLSSEVNGAIDNGITFGDCISADDFICTLAGNAQLAISGSLNYKNINALSFNMQSNLASLLINDNTSLNVYQNLNGAGLTIFGNNTTLGQSPDMQLLMGTSQQGTLNYVDLPAC